jgi:hypothetical protein
LLPGDFAPIGAGHRVGFPLGVEDLAEQIEQLQGL